MRLSEAMRLGSMLRKQGFGGFFKEDGHGEIRSCALGAAEEALTGTTILIRPLRLYQQFSALLYSGERCPLCGGAGDIGGLIMHLNDGHKWTREAIADWIEGIEMSREAAAVVPLEIVPRPHVFGGDTYYITPPTITSLAPVSAAMAEAIAYYTAKTTMKAHVPTPDPAKQAFTVHDAAQALALIE